MARPAVYHNRLDGCIMPLYFCFAMVAVIAATLYKKQKSIVMKKLSAIIVALSLFFSAGAFTASPEPVNDVTSLFKLPVSKFMNPSDVSTAVKKAFGQKFSGAANVTWKENGGYYFAKFVLNEQTLTATYTDDGEMVALSRLITKDQLPLAVAESLTLKYGDYTLGTEITEIAMNGSTRYYLLASGKKQDLLLHCSPDGSVSVDKKIKRKIPVEGAQ
jgi:hypothetical protein